MHAFVGSGSADLSFAKGEAVTVTDMHSHAQWWQARNAAGEAGRVPSNYLHLVNCTADAGMAKVCGVCVGGGGLPRFLNLLCAHGWVVPVGSASLWADPIRCRLPRLHGSGNEPVIGTAVANYAYEQAGRSDHIVLSRGQVVLVTADRGDWVTARAVDGSSAGLAPRNYLAVHLFDADRPDVEGGDCSTPAATEAEPSNSGGAVDRVDNRDTVEATSSGDAAAVDSGDGADRATAVGGGEAARTGAVNGGGDTAAVDGDEGDTVAVVAVKGEGDTAADAVDDRDVTVVDAVDDGGVTVAVDGVESDTVAVDAGDGEGDTVADDGLSTGDVAETSKPLSDAPVFVNGPGESLDDGQATPCQDPTAEITAADIVIGAGNPADAATGGNELLPATGAQTIEGTADVDADDPLADLAALAGVDDDSVRLKSEASNALADLASLADDVTPADAAGDDNASALAVGGGPGDGTDGSRALPDNAGAPPAVSSVEPVAKSGNPLDELAALAGEDHGGTDGVGDRHGAADVAGHGLRADAGDELKVDAGDELKADAVDEADGRPGPSGDLDGSETNHVTGAGDGAGGSDDAGVVETATPTELPVGRVASLSSALNLDAILGAAAGGGMDVRPKVCEIN